MTLERALSSEDDDSGLRLMCSVKIESGEVGDGGEGGLVHGVRAVRVEPESRDLSPAIVKPTIERCEILAIRFKVCLFYICKEGIMWMEMKLKMKKEVETNKD